MAWPTVTLGAGNSGTAAGPASGTVQWSHTVGSGQTMLEVLIGQGSETGASRVTGVTWNGSALTKKTGTASDGSWPSTEAWELQSPTAATANVIVSYTTPAATSLQLFGCSISFDGASTTTGTISTNTGTSANPSVTVADSASGDLVISIVSNDNEATTTTESGTLIGEVEDLQADLDVNGQYQTASGANTVCLWTNATSGVGWAAIGFAVKQAGGGAVDNPRRFDDGVPVAYFTDPGYAAIYIPHQLGITVASRSDTGISAADGSITAANTTTGVGAAIQTADASDTNVLTATGVGAASQKADASDTNALTLTGVGLATVSGAGSITVTNTTIGVGAATQTADASDTNTTTLAGVGASSQGAAASDTNTLTLTGAGAATQSANASDTNVFTLNGEGASVSAGSANGSISAVSGLTGAGASTASGAGFTLRTTDPTLVLGLNFDGDFADLSGFGHVATNSGVVSSASQFKAGTASALFSATGTHITYAATAEWLFGTGDFTVEGWVYPTTVDATRRSLFDFRLDGTAAGTSWAVDFTSSDVRFQMGIGSNLYTASWGTGLTVNTWQHVAIVREGSTMWLYVDGVQRATATASGGAVNGSSGGSQPFFGRRAGGSQNYGGYMDLVQVHATCLYPSGTTFTPAASVLSAPVPYSDLFGVGSSQAPTVVSADGGIVISGALSGVGASKAGAAGSASMQGNLYGNSELTTGSTPPGGKKPRRRKAYDETDEAEMMEILSIVVPKLTTPRWLQ